MAGFYFQSDFHDQLKELPRAAYDRIAGSLCRMYFDGEEPGHLKGSDLAVYRGIWQRLAIAKERSKAGAKSKQNGNKTQSKRKQNGNKPESNPHQDGIKPETNGNQNPTSLLKSESKRERKSITATAVIQESGGGEMEIVYEDDGLAAFIAQALDGWNRISGKQYPALPGDCIRGLTEAYRNGVTPEQLDIALARVGSWQEKYRRTPRAAFADGNLYKWIEDDGEVESYADLDEIFG